MDLLSTQLRCSRCGARIEGPSAAICPKCQADLSQVGAWSELLEWGQVRERGRTLFIWGQGVLWFGGLMALGWSLGLFFLEGERNALFYFLAVIWFMAGGYLYGRLYWHLAERQYGKAMVDGYFDRLQFRRPAHW